MIRTIIELVLVGSKFLTNERANYYHNKANKLLEKIQEVEDSVFYSKDMEKKGKAERELLMESENLGREYIKEAKNEKPKN